jgi:aldehyde dehydrogenase (NAD+)
MLVLSGAQSPNIIFDDADLDQAVRWSSFGIFFNAGQVCCAGSRLFVQASIYERFMEKLRDYVQSLKVGDPFNPETFQGPLISEVQFNRVLSTSCIQSSIARVEL